MTVFDDEVKDMHPVVGEYLEKTFNGLYLSHEVQFGARNRADYAGITIENLTNSLFLFGLCEFYKTLTIECIEFDSRVLRLH